MTIAKILTYLLASIALLFEAFFGLIPFVLFIIQIILIAFALFFLVWIFRRQNAGKWEKIVPRYILTMTATLWFFITLFLSFVGYQHIVPGVISDITLTRSGQQIVFLEMSHIASPDFYTSKKSTLESLSASGYTILFEWVKPGTPENEKIFNQSLGFDLSPTLYRTIADLIWLQSQDNAFLFSSISTGSLVSVDLSIDEIVTLMGTGSQIQAPTEVVNIESEIIKATGLLTPQERQFAGWVARGLLSWSLKQSDDIDRLLVSWPQSRLFETIIDRRNDAIVAYVQEHPTENIAIIYGALHFNWVYESLQRLDPTWTITGIDSINPY